MSGVIVRCPNCGTSRAAPGECEACHEAQARYFCTNHSPGLWLDSTACTRCSARFGQAAAAPAPTRPPAPTTRPAPRPPVAPYRPPPPPPPSAGRTAPPRRPADDVFGRGDEAERRPPAGPPSLEDIFRAAVRARAAARARTGPARDAVAASRGLGGCLVRAVVMLFVFFLMLAGGAFMFASSLFGGF